LEYSNANEWREAAMQRENGISDTESQQRRSQAALFYQQENTTPDADTLADHELFILGKMELEEYEQYLLFKHSAQAI